VLRGCFEALRAGGELYFSDVYIDRRLSSAARGHDVMLGEGLGCALYIEDFKRICHKVP
jgi:arsenite methyltransferase